MRVFSDHHHQALTHSLQLLFEKRLGGQLFNPIGLSWFEQGFWKGASVYGDNLGTVGQYLDTRGLEPDENGIYQVEGRKGITLEKFKETEIDIVIASIPEHLITFNNLIKEYKPKAKLIYQIGNEFGNYDFSLIKNFMVSTAPFSVPSHVNTIFYHQEFDLDIYKPSEEKPKNFIRSFVHCLSQGEGQGSLYRQDWKTFLDLEDLLPEYQFQAFGASCRDGCINEQSEIARLMRESKFGFHLKKNGDGFGHTIFSYFATGKPVIVRKSQYEGKLAGLLMIDGVTCIDLDKGTLEESARRIKAIDDTKYNEMCGNVYKRFKEVVDFEKEFKKIKLFLKKLI